MKNRLIDLLKNIPKPPHIVNGMPSRCYGAYQSKLRGYGIQEAA